jgi:hypothetical protein
MLSFYLNLLICPFPSRIPNKILYALCFSPVRVTCPFRLVFLDFIIPVIFVDKTRK